MKDVSPGHRGQQPGQVPGRGLAGAAGRGVLPAGHALDDVLVARIRERIRTHCSPRHVPAKVIQVADIPRTKSGKISELAVRDVIAGRSVANIDALANPGALALFRDLEDLQS